MAPVELLPAPRRAAQEQTVLRGPLATTADSKPADQVVPLATTADSKPADQVVPLATTADTKQADPAVLVAKTADSKQADPAVLVAKTADSEPTDPPEATADSEPTDPFGPTAWAEQPRLLVPESPLTDRDRPSQSLLSRSQAFKDQALTAQGAMVLRPVARLRTSPGTLKALDPSTSAAKAGFTPSTDPKAAIAPAHRI
jgi:hypothetical protein